MISSEAITVFRPNKGNPVLLKVHLRFVNNNFQCYVCDVHV